MQAGLQELQQHLAAVKAQVAALALEMCALRAHFACSPLMSTANPSPLPPAAAAESLWQAAQPPASGSVPLWGTLAPPDGLSFATVAPLPPNCSHTLTPPPLSYSHTLAPPPLSYSHTLAPPLASCPPSVDRMAAHMGGASPPASQSQEDDTAALVAMLPESACIALLERVESARAARAAAAAGAAAPPAQAHEGAAEEQAELAHHSSPPPPCAEEEEESRRSQHAPRPGRVLGPLFAEDVHTLRPAYTQQEETECPAYMQPEDPDAAAASQAKLALAAPASICYDDSEFYRFEEEPPAAAAAVEPVQEALTQAPCGAPCHVAGSHEDEAPPAVEIDRSPRQAPQLPLQLPPARLADMRDISTAWEEAAAAAATVAPAAAPPRPPAVARPPLVARAPEPSPQVLAVPRGVTSASNLQPSVPPPSAPEGDTHVFSAVPRRAALSAASASSHAVGHMRSAASGAEVAEMGPGKQVDHREAPLWPEQKVDYSKAPLQVDNSKAPQGQDPARSLSRLSPPDAPRQPSSADALLAAPPPLANPLPPGKGHARRAAGNGAGTVAGTAAALSSAPSRGGGIGDGWYRRRPATPAALQPPAGALPARQDPFVHFQHDDDEANAAVRVEIAAAEKAVLVAQAALAQRVHTHAAAAQPPPPQPPPQQDDGRPAAQSAPSPSPTG